MAAASVAHTLQAKCTIYLPEGATGKTLSLLQQEEAHVVVAGRVYADALKFAQVAVEKDPNAYVLGVQRFYGLW